MAICDPAIQQRARQSSNGVRRIVPLIVLSTALASLLGENDESHFSERTGRGIAP
jgi:hypothetical protein